MKAEPGLTDGRYYHELFRAVQAYALSMTEQPADSPRAIEHMLSFASFYRRDIESLVLRLIDDARSAGLQWDQIGDALGVTKQAASQLHKRARRNR